MNISTWSNVAVAVQSALAAADTISAITKANPAVVTSTAHGLANGDYVLLSVQGMHQVDGRIFRVANQAANTFELEGVDSTLFDTFVSGSAQAITFGTTVTTVTGVQVSGGEFDKDETTTIHDAQRSQIPTVASPMAFSMESIWDVADAALIALEAASRAKTTRAVRITFSNGQKVLFNGYVGCTLVPTGTAPGKVVTPLSFDVQRRLTAYAT